jgi:hypothetical protein
MALNSQEGYIYVMSNDSMSGILKIGVTERTPDLRLKEANSSTWIPTPFKIEFAKKVTYAKQKESTIHKLLTQYTERVNHRREFFRISLDEIRVYFDLMDGELWVPKNEECNDIIDEDQDDEDQDDEDQDDEDNNKKINAFSSSSRDLRQYFTEGQRIRHTIGISETWIGVFNASKNVIIHEDKEYKSLSGFVNSHHRNNGTYKHNGVSGWRCSECEMDNEWISTKTLLIQN